MISHPSVRADQVPPSACQAGKALSAEPAPQTGTESETGFVMTICTLLTQKRRNSTKISYFFFLLSLRVYAHSKLALPFFTCHGSFLWSCIEGKASPTLSGFTSPIGSFCCRHPYGRSLMQSEADCGPRHDSERAPR